ncbi:MAG: hypothetical protein NTY48_05700 [Candidatus Diapherotrites archaeon]|nr:hypothetical protein [Candidatus Diapherotrites archaeon]
MNYTSKIKIILLALLTITLFASFANAITCGSYTCTLDMVSGISSKYVCNGSGASTVTQTAYDSRGDALQFFTCSGTMVYWRYYSGILRTAAYYGTVLGSGTYNQITQAERSDYSDHIFSFKLNDVYANWYYSDGYLKTAAYYSNNINGDFTTYHQITQTLTLTAPADSISSFTVPSGGNTKRAYWKYSNGFVGIHGRWGDSISGFSVTGNTATWNFYDGYSETTTPGSMVLTDCAPVNGSCGTGATTYLFTASAFSGPLCSAGTQSPATVLFPAAGSSKSWTCDGLYGGTTASCTATHSSAMDCTQSGVTVPHGSSATFYLTASVPFGSSCQSESRTCTNGTLSGSYAEVSCSILPQNGGWSAWTSCLNESQSRTCNNPAPACGGNSCSGPLIQTCGANPVNTNSIINLLATFDSKINIESQCITSSPAEVVISYVETNEEIARYSTYTCPQNSSITKHDILGLKDKSVILISITIPAPCTVCTKKVYLSINLGNKPASVPDNNLLSIIALIAIVIGIISIKRNKK